VFDLFVLIIIYIQVVDIILWHKSYLNYNIYNILIHIKMSIIYKINLKLWMEFSYQFHIKKHFTIICIFFNHYLCQVGSTFCWTPPLPKTHCLVVIFFACINPCHIGCFLVYVVLLIDMLFMKMKWWDLNGKNNEPQQRFQNTNLCGKQ